MPSGPGLPGRGTSAPIHRPPRIFRSFLRRRGSRRGPCRRASRAVGGRASASFAGRSAGCRPRPSAASRGRDAGADAIHRGRVRAGRAVRCAAGHESGGSARSHPAIWKRQPKEPPREKQLLERLATLAQRFTPRVSLVPPDGLLLEVKGSLHLFGGAEGLCHALEEQCRAAGVEAACSRSRPCRLRRWRARARAKLHRHGSPLISSGSWRRCRSSRCAGPPKCSSASSRSACTPSGEAVRLPRAGFARRFGKPQLAMLDRVTGRHADLRIRFQARERFQQASSAAV